jgi:hypothetical protein
VELIAQVGRASAVSLADTDSIPRLADQSRRRFPKNEYGNAYDDDGKSPRQRTARALSSHF